MMSVLSNTSHTHPVGRRNQGWADLKVAKLQADSLLCDVLSRQATKRTQSAVTGVEPWASIMPLTALSTLS